MNNAMVAFLLLAFGLPTANVIAESTPAADELHRGAFWQTPTLNTPSTASSDGRLDVFWNRYKTANESDENRVAVPVQGTGELLLISIANRDWPPAARALAKFACSPLLGFAAVMIIAIYASRRTCLTN